MLRGCRWLLVILASNCCYRPLGTARLCCPNPAILRRNTEGRRPFNGDVDLFQNDPHWRDLIVFNEYFHGDNGSGVGASHQTGWSAMVCKLLNQLSRYPDG
jgi:hypothetical protein